VWTRAPGVVIGAADNTSGNGDPTGRYAGTREMNSALMDRFAFKEWCEFLPRDLERSALERRTGASRALIDHILDAVDACRAKVQTGEIIDPPSIRAVEAFILALETEQPRDAWNRTIAAAQPAESAVGLEAVYTACINHTHINRSL
jgi:MoxR-like ATPase